MASLLKLRCVKTLVLLELLQIRFVLGGDTPVPTSLCAELIEPNGYPCEEITVETTDGFLLGVQNIPHGLAGPNKARGPPVLLMHGFLGGGDNYVSSGPQKSLGFVLADAGLDVYIGNHRNIQWSHGSSRYKPSQRAYWDWTFDELAAFDIPATVNYISDRRGGSKIFYVGHSQGTMSLFAGLTGGGPAAEQMKDKLRAVVFLAPGAYFDNLSAPFPEVLFRIYGDEILPFLQGGKVDFTLVKNIVCGIAGEICEGFLFPELIGRNSYFDESRFTTYEKYFPQPASAYNVNHLAQVRRSGEFKKYDRGESENYARYGQAKPPLYNLAKFPSESFPLLNFVGGIDQLSDPRDVARALREIPDAGNRQVITIPDYGHADVIVGSRANVDIFPRIITFFQNN